MFNVQEQSRASCEDSGEWEGDKVYAASWWLRVGQMLPRANHKASSHQFGSSRWPTQYIWRDCGAGQHGMACMPGV